MKILRTMNYELLSSILLALIILLPLGRKCEIRFKNILILSLIVGILTGVFTTVIVQLLTLNSQLSTLVVELCFLFVFTGIIGLYRFYRDPERLSPDTDGIILSPADGFIKYIKQPSDARESSIQNPVSRIQYPVLDDSWTIGITMTYLDVHIIRSPIKGVVSSIEKKEDKFLSLKKESAVKLNTQVHIVIVGTISNCAAVGTNSIRAKDFSAKGGSASGGQIKLVLIASRLVRKILVWVEENQEVKRGTRLGKIVFGSQCNIIIPALVGLKIEVQEKQQVYAGITILARLPRLPSVGQAQYEKTNTFPIYRD